MGQPRNPPEGQPEGDLIQDPGIARGKGQAAASVFLVCMPADQAGNGRLGRGAQGRGVLLAEQQPPGVREEVAGEGAEMVPGPAVEHEDTGVVGRDRLQAFSPLHPMKHRFVEVGPIVAVVAAAAAGLLPGVEMMALVALEQPVHVIEEEGVAVEEQDLPRRLGRTQAQGSHLVQRRIADERLRGGPGQIGEAGRVVAAVDHTDAVALSFGKGARGERAIHEQEDRDIAVVPAEAADALHPLPLAGRAAHRRQRVVDQPLAGRRHDTGPWKPRST